MSQITPNSTSSTAQAINPMTSQSAGFLTDLESPMLSQQNLIKTLKDQGLDVYKPTDGNIYIVPPTATISSEQDIYDKGTKYSPGVVAGLIHSIPNAAATAIGGLAGGAAGSLVGPGGIVPGAITGAGLGAGTENMGEQYLKSKLNNQQNFDPNFKEAGFNALGGATAEAGGQLLGPLINSSLGSKVGGDQASSYVGQLLAKLSSKPETVSIGNQSIDIPHLINGTPAQEIEQIGKVNIPIKSAIQRGKTALQNNTLQQGAAIAAGGPNTLGVDPQIQKQVIDTMLQGTGIDLDTAIAKVKEKLPAGATDEDALNKLANPEFYENMLNSIGNRFGDYRASGMSYEDLLKQSPRNLTFLKELAAKREGLLPQESMQELQDLAPQLGDLNAAMTRALRYGKGQGLPFMAPINEATRGSEMIGRSLPDLLSSYLSNSNPNLTKTTKTR